MFQFNLWAWLAYLPAATAGLYWEAPLTWRIHASQPLSRSPRAPGPAKGVGIHAFPDTNSRGLTASPMGARYRIAPMANVVHLFAEES